MRYFNTEGPCFPERHYMLPPGPRLPGARRLIEQGRYFIVHAPRQTGKTTTLTALARELTNEGRHAALRFSCEQGQVAEDDYGAAEALVLEAIRRAAEQWRFPRQWLPPDPWPDAPAGGRIYAGLQDWAAQCPLPLVLFFDEIDALRGQSLISVLRQLRDGFSARAQAFPASVALCGLRDVRDYKAASGGDPSRLGTASPFNIAESLRVGDFTFGDVTALYKQHTEQTGQEFTQEAAHRVFAYSEGQPWLVNALAYEVIDKMRIDLAEPITAEHIDAAKEKLILDRRSHLESLVARLNEERVRKFIEPLIAGQLVTADPAYDDDLSYVRDLGLIGQDRPIAIANPIYREVIVRVLGARAQDSVLADPRSFVLPDGRLDFLMVLEEFAAWWKQHGEFLVKGEVYHEVAPQLIFMAFLTRIVNGWCPCDGQSVDCEYGVGRGRIDILVRKPYAAGNGKRAVQREAVEVKVRTKSTGDPLAEGLEQLDGYLDRLSLDSGTLLIFDRRPSAVRRRPDPKFSGERTPAGRNVTVLRA